jgi:DNA-binding MarR family transcriptional regulator
MQAERTLTAGVLASRHEAETAAVVSAGHVLAGEVLASRHEAETAARLRAAVARLARRLRPTRAAGTLSATEVDMLIVAERCGPARMSEFASFCGLNPTMVSRMVPKLEAAGLLRRRPDPLDKRASTIEATAKGRKLLDAVRSERSDALARLLGQLEGHEKQAIEAALPALEKMAELLAPNAPTARQQR